MNNRLYSRLYLHLKNTFSFTYIYEKFSKFTNLLMEKLGN